MPAAVRLPDAPRPIAEGDYKLPPPRRGTVGICPVHGVRGEVPRDLPAEGCPRCGRPLTVRTVVIIEETAWA